MCNSSNAPFYVGQKIVGVKNTRGGLIKKGSTYEVIEILPPFCSCGYWLVNVGIKSPGFVQCGRCNVLGPKYDFYLFSHWLFAPIQTQYNDMTAEIASGTSITEETPDKIIIPEFTN